MSQGSAETGDTDQSFRSSDPMRDILHVSYMTPLGRFIELGRHDFLVNPRPEMTSVRNSITFVVADVLVIVDERHVTILPAVSLNPGR